MPSESPRRSSFAGLAHLARSGWSKSVSWVRGLFGTEELGHGRRYHGMFKKWEAGTRKIRRMLKLRDEVGINADTRASLFNNLGIIQLASLPHQGKVEIVTDFEHAAEKFGPAKKFSDALQGASPYRIRSSRDFSSELDQAGRLFYATTTPADMADAKRLIGNVHSDSILVLELNTLDEAQGLKAAERNRRIGELANRLHLEAKRQGKRVVLLHGLDGENRMDQPAVALYSPTLWGTAEKPGEARIHAPLAGPVGLIKDVCGRMRKPNANVQAFQPIDIGSHHDRIRHLLNQDRPRSERLTSEDFGLIHTRAGFGGDQLTLAAGLLNGVLEAHRKDEPFGGVPTVLHLPNYWRVQSEFLKAANLLPHGVLADEYLNRDHGAFLSEIEKNPGALVYLENPTNPQGRKLKHEAVVQVLQAAKASGSVVVEDMTLVSPSETPEQRLRHLNDMIRLANKMGVKYLAIASASKYTGNPEAKIGAVLASKEAKHLIEPFGMPVSKKEANLFEKFIGKGFRSSEDAEKRHMNAAYAWMEKFAGRPDTLHQLIQPSMAHLEEPGASSFKMFKLHLPEGMTVADLVADNPQLKDFDPKPLQALCGGVKPGGLSEKVWNAWGGMYRLSPVSEYAIRKGVLEIEKAAKAAFKKAGADWKEGLAANKATLAEKAQEAARKLELAA